VPTDPLAGPLGVVGVETVSVMATKFAVTLLGALIVTVTGFVEPEASPDQLEKLYPVFGVAVTCGLVPLLYQLSPEGLTVPPPEAATDVVNEYWVVKLAV
jgi:hypothetical protein